MSEGNGIVVPKWAVGGLMSFIAAAFVGAYGWCWTINSRVVAMETEQRIMKESAKDDLTEIKEDVKEIRTLLIEYIQGH